MEATLRTEDQEYGCLKLQFCMSRVGIGRVERVVSDFAERVCTGYSSLMGAQASSFCNCLKSLLSDEQSPFEFLGGYGVDAWKDGDLFYHRGAVSNDKRNDHTPPLEGHGYVLEDILPTSSS